jgi:hypothetical protein
MKFTSYIRKGGKLYIILIITAILAVFMFQIVHAVTAAGSEPGTDSNPLVAKDYVDAKYDALTRQLQAVIQGQSTGSGVLFQVVELKVGQQLVAGASAEIIVRSGTASAVSGDKGDGLSDLTTDDSTKGNLVTGQIIPNNHLLLVPRDDGRGIKAVSDKVYIMLKGTYTLK